MKSRLRVSISAAALVACAAAVVLIVATTQPTSLHSNQQNARDHEASNTTFSSHVSFQSLFHTTPAHWQAGRLQLPSQNTHHKALWPLNAKDIVMISFAVFSIFVAAGGGIGGGGVLVPLYILIGDFTTHQSVALSNITIMGGAVANFVCNVHRKHPKANRPLIDWDLILVMEPMTIVGALLGGYLNKLLPVWLTTTLLAALLTLMTWKLLTKGLQTFRKESVLLSLQDSPTSNGHGAAQPLLARADTTALDCEPANGLEHAEEARGNGVAAPAGPEVEELQQLLKEESSQVPLLKVAVLVGVSCWVVVSDSLKQGVPCGSWRYWGVVLSLLPCAGVVMLEMRRHLLWKVQVKAAGGHDYAHEELHWTPVTTLLYPAICSLAGIIAGLFGVGGGIVKGPLMLELGVAPEVAAATSATMIMFTAGAACIIFIHFGGVVWDYAALLVTLGFLVTLAGQLATYRIIHALGRRSVIIFMMGTLMAMATSIMYYQTLASWVGLAHHPERFGHFGEICPSK